MNHYYEKCNKCKKYFKQAGLETLDVFDGIGKVCDDCKIEILSKDGEGEKHV